MLSCQVEMLRKNMSLFIRPHLKFCSRVNEDRMSSGVLTQPSLRAVPLGQLNQRPICSRGRDVADLGRNVALELIIFQIKGSVFPFQRFGC